MLLLRDLSCWRRGREFSGGRCAFFGLFGGSRLKSEEPCLYLIAPKTGRTKKYVE